MKLNSLESIIADLAEAHFQKEISCHNHAYGKTSKLTEPIINSAYHAFRSRVPRSTAYAFINVTFGYVFDGKTISKGII